MANRSRAFVVSQVGEEVTPGTTVPANLLLPNTKIILAGAGDENQVNIPSGHLFPRSASNSLEWGAGSYEMKAAFDESYVLFNGLFRKVTATGATLAKTRVWTPSVNAMDAYATYTGEVGQAGAADQFANILFNSLNFTVGKQESPMFTGDVIARRAVPITALTGSPTLINSSVLSQLEWDFFTATTWANLSASPVPLTTGWRAEFAFGPKYSWAAFIDSSSQSWDAAGVGDPIPNNINVVLPYDVSAGDYVGPFNLAAKRAGTPLYFRIRCRGSVIESAVRELFQIDMCLYIKNVPSRTDIGPFIGLSWPCGLMIDSASGKALEITTISHTA